MTAPKPATPAWLTPGEVAAILRVDPKTAGRWHKAGRWPEGSVIRTPGGTRRYSAAVVAAIVRGDAL